MADLMTAAWEADTECAEEEDEPYSPSMAVVPPLPPPRAASPPPAAEQSRPLLTMLQAKRLLLHHGYVIQSKNGVIASIRQEMVAKMQVPNSSASTADYYVKVFLKNTPASIADILFMGWKRMEIDEHSFEMTTDYPKYLAEVASLHLVRPKQCVGGAKLLKPPKGPAKAASSAVLFLTVPARAVFYTNSKTGVEWIDFSANLAILNEVLNSCKMHRPRPERSHEHPHRRTALPAQFGKPVRFPLPTLGPPVRSLALVCAQYGRLTTTAAHPKIGRKVLDFQGYSNESEREVMKHAVKTVKQMVSAGLGKFMTAKLATLGHSDVPPMADAAGSSTDRVA